MIKSLEQIPESHKYPVVKYKGIVYECLYWEKTKGNGECSGLCDKCDYAVDLSKKLNEDGFERRGL